jgi:hypothetical protein
MKDQQGTAGRGGRGRGSSSTPTAMRSVKPVPNGPSINETITGRELDSAVLKELTALTTENAQLVSQHLVMAGLLLEKDPEIAYLHAVAARDKGGRVASVREAAGLTAYATERYSEALAELRTVRRISGSVEHWPLMADCERGLGRPERALAMAVAPEVSQLSTVARVEMRIVASGARRDKKEFDAAVLELQGPELRVIGDSRASPWAARLVQAYIDALTAAGRLEDAALWTTRIPDDDDEIDIVDIAADQETEL